MRICNKWYIEIKDRNYTLCRIKHYPAVTKDGSVHPNAGEEYFDIDGHYSDLESCLQAIPNKETLKKGADTLESLLKLLKAIRVDIKEAMKYKQIQI